MTGDRRPGLLLLLAANLVRLFVERLTRLLCRAPDRVRFLFERIGLLVGTLAHFVGLGFGSIGTRIDSPSLVALDTILRFTEALAGAGLERPLLNACRSVRLLARLLMRPVTGAQERGACDQCRGQASSQTATRDPGCALAAVPADQCLAPRPIHVVRLGTRESPDGAQRWRLRAKLSKGRASP
ncbi:hypothetical protein NOVOSPHI9U_10564 [Novosphingobium sp. 9U]|nr:hypothetical protein NOVOSPHI9U_10564 [Novosphingobium sp. 9U]